MSTFNYHGQKNDLSLLHYACKYQQEEKLTVASLFNNRPDCSYSLQSAFGRVSKESSIDVVQQLSFPIRRTPPCRVLRVMLFELGVGMH